MSDVDPGQLIDGVLRFIWSDQDDSQMSDDLVGSKYSITRILGCDGQATVVKGLDNSLCRDVVLKIYHEAISDNQRCRIINEGRALANIDSPNVVKCHGVEEVSDLLVLVLEYVEGETLERRQFKEHGEREIARLFGQVARGIEAAHGHGFLHLDLKPSNVLVDSNDQVKIIDFGLVRSTSWNQKDVNVSGTPTYMPPEIARNKQPIDERADIFGLGAILFFVLTDQAPFQAESKKESRELAVKGVLPEIPKDIQDRFPKLSSLCQSCLCENPEDRILTAKQVRKEAEKISNPGSKLRAMAWPLLGLLVLALGGWLTAKDGLVDSKLVAKRIVAQESELVDNDLEVLDLLAQGKWDAASERQGEGLHLVSQKYLGNGFRKEQELKQDCIGRIGDLSQKVVSKLPEAFSVLRQLKLANEQSDPDEIVRACPDLNCSTALSLFDDAFGSGNIFSVLLTAEKSIACKVLFFHSRQELNPRKELINAIKEADDVLEANSSVALNLRLILGEFYGQNQQLPDAIEMFENVVQATENESGCLKIHAINGHVFLAIAARATDKQRARQCVKFLIDNVDLYEARNQAAAMNFLMAMAWDLDKDAEKTVYFGQKLLDLDEDLVGEIRKRNALFWMADAYENLASNTEDPVDQKKFWQNGLAKLAELTEEVENWPQKKWDTRINEQIRLAYLLTVYSETDSAIELLLKTKNQILAEWKQDSKKILALIHIRLFKAYEKAKRNKEAYSLYSELGKSVYEISEEDVRYDLMIVMMRADNAFRGEIDPEMHEHAIQIVDRNLAKETADANRKEWDERWDELDELQK